MGQQQLLLLVFGIVMVGGAVVAGAHALEGGKTDQNGGLVFQEALAVVHDLQEWKRRPLSQGGGAHVSGFEHVSFKTLGYPHTLLSNRVYKTDFACYVLAIVEEGQAAEINIFSPSCAKRDFVARVVVRGTGPADLDWSRHAAPVFPTLGR